MVRWGWSNLGQCHRGNPIDSCKKNDQDFMRLANRKLLSMLDRCATQQPDFTLYTKASKVRAWFEALRGCELPIILLRVNAGRRPH